MNLDAVIYIDASPNVCLQRIKKEIEMEKRVLLVIICNHVKIIMTTGYSSKSNLSFRIDTDDRVPYD